MTALLVGAVVAVSAFGLLRDAFNAAMDAVPPGIDQAQVRAFLSAQAGVTAVHHLHIWSLGAGEIAMTAHLVRPGDGDHDAFIDRIVHELDDRFGINHPDAADRARRRLRARPPRSRAARRTTEPQAGTARRPLRGSLYFRRCKRGPEPAMINDIHKDAQTRMAKSVEALAPRPRPRSAPAARRPRWSTT